SAVTTITRATGGQASAAVTVSLATATASRVRCGPVAAASRVFAATSVFTGITSDQRKLIGLSIAPRHPARRTGRLGQESSVLEETMSRRYTRPSRFWETLAVVIVKPLSWLLVKRDWRHGERIPRDEGIIIVANHLSWTDPVL